MSEKYLNQLRANGDLIEQLRVHAKEYNGPGGQCQTALGARQIKKEALLNAAKSIEQKISGVHLVKLGDYIVVKVEINGEWQEIIKEHVDGNFSHIKEFK